jgi:phospholipid-binding lipoprotein MlaA
MKFFGAKSALDGLDKAPALKLSLVSIMLMITASCSTTQLSDDPYKHVAPDPIEGLNRSIYKFNRSADKWVLKPVAAVYDKSLPSPAKTGVSNFFNNLREPLNIVNNLLQGKMDRALDSTYRFTVNSTVGLLGLVDVANRLDVKPAPEDFGQTLAAWGAKPGAYLMLPLMGPSNLRDGFGRLVSSAVYYPINEITDTSSVRTGLVLIDVISLRASLLRNDKILESQLDEYAFLKRAFEQLRIDAIYDGNPPVREDEDYDDF